MLALAAPGSGQESGSVLLRIRMEPGQTYRMSFTTQTDASQTVMGQEQQTHQSNETVMLGEVLAVDEDGAATVRATYESMRVVQEGPMGRMEYDSTDPESTPAQPFRPFAVLMGESFTMVQAPDGSVIGVEGFEEVLPRMFEEMDLPPGPMRDQLEQTLEDQFGVEAMTQMMRQAGPLFPAGPVAVGDSWGNTAEIERPLPLSVETTWTLRERRDGVAHLDIAGATVSAGSMEMAEMVMTTDLSGVITGTVEVDEATGMTLRMRTQDESTGTITVSGGPMGEMVMPMTTWTVTTFELLPGR